MIETSIENNNLDNLPKEVQDKFKLRDCYVYIDLTKELIDELNNKIINTLDEIEDKTKKVKKILSEINQSDDNEKNKLEKQIDKEFWTEIDKNKEYYFWNLCGYNRNQHKPWDEYLKEIDLLNGKDVELNTDDDDLNWLNDL